MPLPTRFLEELQLRTPMASLVGRRVRLARSGKQWKGCCPFHGEKTPSFYVYDDGYHCFGCGAHGDAISFVMQSEGLGFMEAVASLASAAGLDVPKPTPEAAAAEQRRVDITAVLQAAQSHYQRRLHLPGGRTAREYLGGRGLQPETIALFGLGWSGERGALSAELLRAGMTQDNLLEAGLLRRDEETGRTYELFHERIMFPIYDRRGGIISFGGRILGSGQPKYLNGPDTQVFAKRRNLYGLNFAREGVRNGNRLVVVEGYMDVIAAGQAGFGGAVAPLGTALTTEQLEMLWQVSPAPLLCFDGDAAGARAANRAMEVALPMLTASRTLHFATLPANEDPDSLVRKGGKAAFDAVLDAARPAADTLYDMVRAETGETTPEQRAAMRSRLIEVCGRIKDKNLAAEYRRALLDRFFAARRTPVRGGRVNAERSMRAPRIAPHSDHSAAERTRVLVAMLIRHPFLLRDVSHAFTTLPLAPAFAELRAAMEEWAENVESLDSAALIDHLTLSGFQINLAQVLADTPLPLPAFASSGAMPVEVEEGWWHLFGFLNVEQLREEVALAEAEASRDLNADTQRRLLALRSALNRIHCGDSDVGETPDV